MKTKARKQAKKNVFSPLSTKARIMRLEEASRAANIEGLRADGEIKGLQKNVRELTARLEVLEGKEGKEGKKDSPKPAPMYRLLNVGEMIRAGDENYTGYNNKWQPTWCVGQPYAGVVLIRRLLPNLTQA